jgi:hypothetical protein
MKYIKNTSEIPTTPHLAVIYTETYTIPGDERSRTNPGHGYPESTGTSVNYIVMEDEAELEKWIKLNAESRNSAYQKSFVVIRAKPLTIKTEVHIFVE